MIRELLLWASRNSGLARSLPRKRFVQRAVRRFMPGEGREDAIRAALELHAQGIPSVFTLLGENVNTERQAAEAVKEYLALLERVNEVGLDAHLSVKLTQLGFDQREELALENLLTLVTRAQAQGSMVWIDMEDSSYKEATLRLYRKALAGAPGGRVGLCLQAYLRSTPEDLATLLPLAPLIRLVKGAYAEPPELAFPARTDVDEAFFQLGRRLLEAGGEAAFATHDMRLVERIRGWIRDSNTHRSRYEFQMLYGIRGEEQRRLAAGGEPVRVLISYGPAWFPWYMRRLAERPANLWFVAKNLVRG